MSVFQSPLELEFINYEDFIQVYADTESILTPALKEAVLNRLDTSHIVNLQSVLTLSTVKDFAESLFDGLATGWLDLTALYKKYSPENFQAMINLLAYTAGKTGNMDFGAAVLGLGNALKVYVDAESFIGESDMEKIAIIHEADIDDYIKANLSPGLDYDSFTKYVIDAKLAFSIEGVVFVHTL